MRYLPILVNLQLEVDYSGGYSRVVIFKKKFNTMMFFLFYWVLLSFLVFLWGAVGVN